MPAVARIGYGATIAYGDGATPIENFTAVGQIVDIDPPQGSAAAEETTHILSPLRTKEYIGGAVDPGKLQFTVRMDLTDAGHKAVRAKLGVKGNWKVSYPGDPTTDGTAPPIVATDTFAAVLTGFKPAKVGISTVMTAGVELQLSGPITSTP